MLDFSELPKKCCVFCAWEPVCNNKPAKCGMPQFIAIGKNPIIKVPPCKEVLTGEWSGCVWEKGCKHLKLFRELAEEDKNNGG